MSEWDGLDLGWLSGRAGSKWQRREPDVLPAWIAEMDFPVAPVIVDAVRRVTESGVWGYPDWSAGTPLRTVFAQRMASRFGWEVDPDAVREFSTVTQAVHVMVQLGTRPGDAVALHTPVFGPLWEGVVSAGRRPVAVPMLESSSGWWFDVEEFERRVVESGCRMVVLVNPHNPTGRVLSRAELRGVAEVADRHGLLVVSDEVHGELVFEPHRHVPFASLGSSVQERTVTVTSASKAFNLSGSRCAVAHVGPGWLRSVVDTQAVELFGAVNVFGVAASCAAWSAGDEWLAGTVDYLDGNRRLVDEVLRERAPGVVHHLPEGTFLSWLDCRGWGGRVEPAARVLERGRVLVSAGSSFNPGGDGFVRLNFATSRQVLRLILDRFVGCVGVEEGAC